MAKATAGPVPVPHARMRRVVMIAAIVVLAALLAVGLVGFFADPLHLPDQVLSVLDRRASVLSMFIGAAGLVVAMAALVLQLRAERAHSPAKTPALSDGGSETPPRVSASEQGRVFQSGSDQPRSYGGDHIEFHDNTFTSKVVGKSVTGSQPSPQSPPLSPGVSGDERR